MSLKSVLLQQIINFFQQSNLISQLTDDDIELLMTAAKYADKREQTASNLTNTAGNAGVNTTPSRETVFVNRVDTVSGNPVRVAPTPQPAVDPSTAHDAAQTLSFDRGPEPQEVGEVLDTKAPSDTDTNADFDPNDPPPDYTRLPQALPSVKG